MSEFQKAATRMAEPTAPKQIERLHFGLLFSATFIAASGNTAMQSVMPSIGRALKVPDIYIASIFSFSALLYAICGPYWGRKADEVDRKKLTIIGTIGYAISQLGLGCVLLAGLLGHISPLTTILLFMIFRSFNGLLGSASSPAAQAYVAERTAPADRTAAFGLLASAFGLGTIVGPALAPLFVFPPFDLSGPLFAFAVLAFLVALLVFKYLPQDLPTRHHSTVSPGKRHALEWSDPRFARTLLFCGILASTQASISQSLGFLIIDRLALDPMQGLSFISIALMAGASATLLAQWGLIRMMSFDNRRLMQMGALLAAIGCGMLAISSSYHSIVVAYALASLGYGLARPGIAGATSVAVGAEQQGAIAGKVLGINSIVFVFAPAFSILTYQYSAHLLYSSLMAALALSALPWFYKHLPLAR
jgi:MFS family permease